MASGIIYLAIIGMWAAYFLPRWVHDRNEFSGKSVERYKSALRIVASSSPGGSSGTGVIHTDLDHEAKIAQLLMRRRIIFSLITISFTMTIVGAMMQTLAISFIGIPVLGFVLYLAYVRHQSNAERRQRRRITQLQRSTAGVSSTNLSEVLAPKESTEHWIPLTERELTRVTILPKGTAAARGEWQPNSVPVPTYVNAPKAITPKRVLDLTTPGQWSEEQERIEREALAAAAPSRDEIFDQQLADEAVARLKQTRAANE
jgi:hypothetical protein